MRSKKNKKSLSFNKTILAICLFIFIFLFSIAVFNEKGLFKNIDLVHKIDSIKKKISFLENENEMLIEAVGSYKSGDFQIKKIAREDLALAKKNEIIIKIIKEEKESKN